MTKQLSGKNQVTLSPDMLIKAQQRARALGMTLSEYMQSLVDKDMQSKEHDPWLEPIPRELNEKWQKDIAEFDEQDKINPRPGAKTADELINQLDQETTQLPGDEGN
jgi:hypothetical protein